MRNETQQKGFGRSEWERKRKDSVDNLFGSVGVLEVGVRTVPTVVFRLSGPVIFPRDRTTGLSSPSVRHGPDPRSYSI